MQKKKKLNRWALMCPNLEEAKRSREHIAHPPKSELDWWSWLEHTIHSTPKDKPFPKGVPLGNLPELRGTHGGFTSNLTGAEEDVVQYNYTEKEEQK